MIQTEFNPVLSCEHKSLSTSYSGAYLRVYVYRTPYLNRELGKIQHHNNGFLVWTKGSQNLRGVDHSVELVMTLENRRKIDRIKKILRFFDHIAPEIITTMKPSFWQRMDTYLSLRTINYPYIKREASRRCAAIYKSEILAGKL
jgi:hypothetical protein